MSKLKQSLLQFRKLVTGRMMKAKPSDSPTYVKHYCCLYHFATGKKQKSSTPCYNHVPLGVINPIPATVPRSPRGPPTDLKISTKPHAINFHTHDLNEIQNKQSLPKRLVYPRVYVEQILPKMNDERCNIEAGHQAFLKKKEFQDIFLMFKKYAKLTGLKTEDQAFKHIQKYSKSRSISSEYSESQSEEGLPQYFYQQNDLINYLYSIGFSQEQAEQFWKMAYNQCRFISKSSVIPSKKVKEVISMRAFVYNLKKFYLDELQSYKNCLSETALHQRMIDLRLFLDPWFNRNIIFKTNHQFWKEIQLEICTQLKRYGENKLYDSMIASIELRNKIWLFMRTLSKIFYIVTDQKNIGLQVFNQKATDLILKNKENLQVFAQFVNEFETFLLQNNKSKDQKFKITYLLQFAKNKLPKYTSHIIIYLRGLFKYLYFFKNCSLLSINKQTLNLDCSAIAQVTYSQVLEFLSFKQKETNHLMEMIEAVCKEINEVVDARSEINGHKKFLNQCNYLAQALLKMIKRCDFMVFYRLSEARKLYQEGDIANLTRLKEIFNENSLKNQEISHHFWKQTFQFIEQPKVQASVSTQKDENFDKNYKIALDSYEELRKKLQGKLPNCPEKSNYESNIEGQSVKGLKSKKQGQKKSKKSQQIEAKLNEGVQNAEQTTTTKMKKHECYNSSYCSLCDDVCSTSVSSSLNNIDNMSAYIMDMLRGI